MSLFCPHPRGDPYMFTWSQESRISLSHMGLPSPLHAAVICLQSLSRSADERQGRSESLITGTGAAFPPAPATCVSLIFRDAAHVSATGFLESLITPRTMLLRWGPSGIADFSSPKSSTFSITCSDISLVWFCVQSTSPGQVMNLCLAFPFKSSWVSQGEGRGEV